MIGASLLLAAARRSSLLDGLAGYWPMNGNGNDVLGVSNGVLFGTGSSFGAGRVGQAFHSIGNARYELGSNAQIKPTTAITLGGWFWFNGSQGGNARLCADWHQNGSIDRWIFPYVPDGITMQLHMFGVSTTLGVLGSTISAATWALLTATWDQATGNVRAYLNATAGGVTGGQTASLVAGTGANASLGQQAGGAFLGLDGRLCEFAMWNRAITAAEVTEWHNAGAGRTHPFS